MSSPIRCLSSYACFDTVYEIAPSSGRKTGHACAGIGPTWSLLLLLLHWLLLLQLRLVEKNATWQAEFSRPFCCKTFTSLTVPSVSPSIPSQVVRPMQAQGAEAHRGPWGRRAMLVQPSAAPVCDPVSAHRSRHPRVAPAAFQSGLPRRYGRMPLRLQLVSQPPPLLDLRQPRWRFQGSRCRR